MRFLVIPDIHNRIEKAQKILDAEYDNVDEVILLGDYFDDFQDNGAIFLKTARWIGDKLWSDKIRAIPGNHDVSYMHHRLRCCGWTKQKQMLFDACVRDNTIVPSKFLSHVMKDGLLFTHAGLPVGLTLHSQVTHLDKVINDRASDYNAAALFTHKRDGGSLNPAGILWNRPQYNQINDSIAFQVFGHTPNHIAPYQNPAKTWLCMDSHNKHYLIIETTKGVPTAFEVKETNKL